MRHAEHQARRQWVKRVQGTLTDTAEQRAAPPVASALNTRTPTANPNNALGSFYDILHARSVQKGTGCAAQVIFTGVLVLGLFGGGSKAKGKMGKSRKLGREHETVCGLG